MTEKSPADQGCQIGWCRTPLPALSLAKETAGVLVCTAAGQYPRTGPSLSLAFAIFVCSYFLGKKTGRHAPAGPAHCDAPAITVTWEAFGLLSRQKETSLCEQRYFRLSLLELKNRMLSQAKNKPTKRKTKHESWQRK